MRPKYTRDYTNHVFIGVGAYCEKDSYGISQYKISRTLVMVELVTLTG